jgi:glutamate 5-kinase
MNIREKIINNTKTLVIKIGSSLLSKDTAINLDFIENLALKVSNLKEKGLQVVIVTSGAVSLGMDKLGITEKPNKIPKRQAMAAIGQPLLMHHYSKAFEKHDLVIAQILLTKEGIDDRTRFLNAKNALYELLNENVIPIINENDSVSVDELKLGDNDQLSSQVAHLVDADLLLIMTDIDGLYDQDPRYDQNAKRISLIEDIKKIDDCNLGGNSTRGTGGMITKVIAAKQAMSFGIATWIVSGKNGNILDQVFNSSDCGSLFYSEEKTLKGKKFWIAYSSQVKGSLTIDEGASNALLKSNKSLLPKGVIKLTGSFEIGDTVDIKSMNGKVIARGLVNYSSREASLIIGFHSDQIEKKLGYKYYDEIINRDNLVLL